ncbi:Zinc finger protein 862, partial [Dissostichus eleginoides]
PVVSESAGTNSQSTEGEAAGPSVVEAAEGPSVVEAAAGPSVVEAAAGPSVIEAAAGPSVVEAGADSKHRHSGWNPDWLKMPQFKNWHYLTQIGMFCRICRQHKPQIKKGPLKRAFIEVGILVFRKDYMDRHISSEPHQYSVKHQVSLASGYSVMQAFEPTVIMEHEAVIGGFKCLYWLVKNEMAHHTNYPKLLSLAQLLGCDYFEKLKVARDKVISSNQPRDGKADSVVAAIKSVLQKKELPVDRLYGLGTDGAAVMTGRLNGVAKQLTDSFPKLVSVACAAHRLALACKDASNAVKYMANFRNHLQELHLFFRNSANRSATLRSAATTLGLNDLKVKEVKDTRWLSQDLAVQNLQRNLPAMLAALAEEASTRKCPVAKGAGAIPPCYSGENSGSRRDPTPGNVPCSARPRPGQPRWTWGL